MKFGKLGHRDDEREAVTHPRREARHRRKRVAIELPPGDREDGETLTFTVRALTGRQVMAARKQATSAEGHLDEYDFYCRAPGSDRTLD